MSQINSMMCCGTLEYKGLNARMPANEVIQDVTGHLAEFMGRANSRAPCAHVIMTEVMDQRDEWLAPGVGNDVIALINEHKLGEVTVGPTKRNPNSGNQVRALVWTINFTGMKRFSKGGERYEAHLRNIRVRRYW